MGLKKSESWRCICSGTIAWPNGADMDPNVLYYDHLKPAWMLEQEMMLTRNKIYSYPDLSRRSLAQVCSPLSRVRAQGRHREGEPESFAKTLNSDAQPLRSQWTTQKVEKTLSWMGNEQLPLDSNKLVHDGFATDKDVGGWPIDDRIIAIPHVDTPCVFVILNAERTRSSSSSRAGEGNLLVAVTIVFTSPLCTALSSCLRHDRSIGRRIRLGHFPIMMGVWKNLVVEKVFFLRERRTPYVSTPFRSPLPPITLVKKL